MIFRHQNITRSLLKNESRPGAHGGEQSRRSSACPRWMADYLFVPRLGGQAGLAVHALLRLQGREIWLRAMLLRAHPNLVVTLAAKLARIVWAVLLHEEDFDRQALATA